MKKVLMFCILVLTLQAEAQQKIEHRKSNCSNPYVTSDHTHYGSNGKIYTYEYKLDDWNPNADCYIKPRHYKDRIFIKINNINRMTYQVKIKDSTYAIALPNISLFDTLMTQLAGSFSATSKDKADIEPTDSEVAKPALSDGEKIIKKNGKKVELSLMEDPFLEKKKKINVLQKNIKSDYLKLLDELKKMEYLTRFGTNLPLLIANECCNQADLKAKIEKDLNIQSLFGEIKSNDISNSLNTIASNANSIKSTEKSIKDNFAVIKVLIDEIKESCRNNNKLLFIFCNTESLEEGKYPKDIDKVMETASKVDKKKIIDAITLLQTLLAQVANKQNFTFLSDSYVARGDELIIQTTIEPRNSSVAKLNTFSITHNIPVRGKFEWAVGPTLVFHVGKSLFDETFSIDTTQSFHVSGHPDSGKYLITKNAVRTKLVPSLGLMANFYWQNHSAVTPGIAIGLATSASDLSGIKAYLGGSLLLGSLSEKLLFNLGVAFGSVNRLKPNLIEGLNLKAQIPFNGDQLGSPNDLVEKVFRTGIFFGFSYKLN